MSPMGRVCAACPLTRVHSFVDSVTHFESQMRCAMETQSRPATGYPANAYPHPQPNAYPNSAPAAPAYAAYAAPPPHAAYYNPNNAAYYPPPYPDPRATLIRRLFTILIASFVIAISIAFILWIIIRPRVPEFQVDSLALSNFNLSSSSSLITGNWDVRFTVQNPNHKIVFYYDNIAASVYYKDQLLSETTVPPFVQGTRNQTTVGATFAAAGSYVGKPVVDGINGDRKSGSSVKFIVRMLARVRLKAGWWRARQRFLRVYCADLAVGLSSNSAGGTMVGGARQCKVGL